MVTVKNIHLNLAWAKAIPTVREVAARAKEAIKGEFKDSRNVNIVLTTAHKTINKNSYFYNYYFATTYLNLRATDNMSLF